MKEASIIKLAIKSRLIVCFIQFFSNILIPDHNPGVFLYPKFIGTKTIFDSLIEILVSGFLRWDAQYFMHIAKYGYTYENTLAFFPLYPLTVRYLTDILLSIFPFLTVDSTLLVSFLSVNIVLFCLSALTLYKLSTIFFSQDFAYRATVLFCFNPASIFFTAPYTECLFSYLSFKSMLNCVLLYQKYSDIDRKIHISDLIYLSPISLSCITRSNGILNVGFFIFTIFCIFIQKLECKSLRSLLRDIVIAFLGILLSLFPFIYFQYYTYQRFCTDDVENIPTVIRDYAVSEKFILPGGYSTYKQSWCSKTLPLSYSYVQAKYWDVGFLKYYKLKQLPNFLLALPIIIITLNYSLKFLYKNLKLNIRGIFNFNRAINNESTDIFQPVLLVYVVHVLVLTIFSVLFIHVQVTTRMLLSASPVVYWYAAYHFLGIKIERTEDIMGLFIFKARNVTQIFIKYYFLGYFIVGTVLFCNYLPWT